MMRLNLAPKPMEAIEKNSSNHEIKNWAENTQKSQKSKILQHNIGDELTQKHGYTDANQEFTTDPRRPPSSFPYLIGNENVFLAHFYTTNTRMKLGSDKEPQPSRVLYIDPSKRLNDYYTPRV
jgi:hypothetical protein